MLNEPKFQHTNNTVKVRKKKLKHLHLNLERVMLVHDKRSNDSRSSNVRFMHKLSKYVYFK